MSHSLINRIRSFYVRGFIGILFLLLLKVLFNIVIKGIPFTVTEFFSLTALYTLCLIAALSFLLFHVGRQIKDMLGFSYTATGIVAFFAFTFLINIILGLHGLSTARMEVMTLYTFVIILLLLRMFYLKGISSRLLFLGGVAVACVVLYILPASTFPDRMPILEDEKKLWYPLSVTYFDNGLVNTIQYNSLGGYGLFVHHVWVTLKRFVIMNPNALHAYYFAPFMLFVLAISWILELGLAKKTTLIVIAFFSLHILSQVWLCSLFVNSLMGEGITALFFGIVVSELLSKSKDTFLKIDTVIKNILFWCVVGVLFLTKPFISYLIFILPCFIIQKKLFQRWTNSVAVMIPCIAIVIAPFLWTKLTHMLNTHAMYYYTSFSTSIHISALIPVLQHWLLDRISLLIAIISIPCFFIGWKDKNRKAIICSLLLVVMNLMLVWGLYVTVWGNYSDKHSAYRYFAQIYYVFLFAVALSLDAIVKKTEIQQD